MHAHRCGGYILRLQEGHARCLSRPCSLACVQELLHLDAPSAAALVQQEPRVLMPSSQVLRTNWEIMVGH